MDPEMLYSLIANMVLTPFAFIGLFFLMQNILEFVWVRGGKVKGVFFTQSRGIKVQFAKPEGEFLKINKTKAYRYSPKALYRWGHTPTMFYNEDSIDPIDPLTRSVIGLNTERLSELLIRWFNLGVISNIKKEGMLHTLLIVLIVAVAGLAAVSFISFQGMNGIMPGVTAAINAIPDKVAALIVHPAAVNNTIPVLA